MRNNKVTNAYHVATALWLAIAAVQFVVWALVAMFHGSADGFWFLWETVFGGIVVAGLRFASRNYRPRSLTV
jgi:hypothetical protein